MLMRAGGWKTQEFGSAAEFAEQSSSLSPGPVLLDLWMPGMGGLDLLESGTIDMGRFVTIVVTGHGQVESAVRSLKAGALDFLEKPFSADDLMQAVAAAGKRVLDNTRTRRPDQALELIERLTSRELDVLRGLVGGLPYKLIAHRLEISARTVEMHRDKLLRKMEVRTNGEAMRLAVLADVQPLT